MAAAAARSSSSWTGQPRIRGSTEAVRLFLLTFSLIGLQFCWGTEQTYATPYLLALGLSKGGMSLVWIAGPLSGLIMQPIIGMISDKSTNRLGRRRPFMIGGTVAVAACLLILGWAKEIVAHFYPEGEQRRKATIWLAVVDIYILDFVINIAQATCRALVVDALPVSKQQIGAAWVTRMVGLGHILVFGFGALDLNAILPASLFGDTQFKKVCAAAALAMIITQGVTCWAVTERVLVSDGKESGPNQSLASIVYHIYERALFVPARIQAICWVQFWSWIGWFPIMFYGSTWIGEIYLRHEVPQDASGDALSQVGRVGSTALIIHSFIGLITAIVLPNLVTSPGDDERLTFTPRPPESLRGIMGNLGGKKPSLLDVWTFGNALFAFCLVWAPLVKGVGFATFLLAACGIPSAVAGLAVSTFIGVEINRMSSALPTARSRSSSAHRFSDDIELENTREDGPLHLRHPSESSVATSSTGELSGIYLGILNIYTTLPQFVGTGISWVVFSILEPGKSPELANDAKPKEHHSKEGVSGIGVCLFIGAISAVIGAFATRRLKE